MNEKVDFPRWIENQYFTWLERTRNRRGISGFANTLGISRQLLSYWMSGRRSPSNRYIHLLALKLGPDVYDVLGFPREKAYKEYLFQNWDQFSEDTRAELFKLATERQKLQEQNFNLHE